MKKSVLTLICAAFMAACGGGPGTSVSIKFGTPATPGPSPANFSVAGGSLDHAYGHYVGSNGTLDITAIWVIVEEFELEAVETADCDDDVGTDDCADFEREYFFIPVPLDGTTITVVSTPIANGTYDELEVEIDDVHVHLDDPEEVAEADLIEALWKTVEAEFMDWPREASMVVTGFWTAAGTADPVPFETYFDADIEVEMDIMNPVLEVTDSGTNRELIILLDPGVWFVRADGSVWDLKSLEGRLIDFDLEIDDGFELKID